LYNYFYSGLQFDGPPRFESANIPSEPGLFYLYHYGSGLYSFDFFKQKKIDLISDEHDYSMTKWIYHSLFANQTIIRKEFAGIAYTELYVFDTNSCLTEVSNIFNYQDQDSIEIYDLVFSEDRNIVYSSFQKSRGRSLGIASYFGCYHLEKKELYRAPFELPWSSNPYYMAYSQKHQRVYLMGGSNRFYIINVQNFTIEQTIIVPNKAGGPSRIVLSPDENFAFVSCSNSDFVAVIDLEKPAFLTKIDVPHPYRMIIP
jgi:DNA-binding beta-propeller fold protein YncE